MTLESLNAELTLSIIDFLPVTESCRLCQVTKRLYYLVHQLRVRRGPELMCTRSHTWNNNKNSALDVYRDALSRMQSPPQLVLFFSGPDSCTLAEDLPLLSLEFPAPKGAAVLGCDSEDPIQTIHCDSSSSPDDACECDGKVSVMVLGGLPEDTTKIQPFLVQDHGSTTEKCFLPPFDDDTDWKTFIIFSSHETPPQLVNRLQEKYPKALIVGGCCESAVGYFPRGMEGYRRAAIRHRYRLVFGKIPPRAMSIKEMCETIRQHEGPILHSAVCGVALAGEIPFHAMVSRGLESLTCKQDFVVSRSDYYSGGGRPYHLVSEVVNRSSGARIPLNGAQFWQRFGAEAVGIRYPNNDGFTVYGSVYDVGDGLMIYTFDEKSITECAIDSFRFTQESMLADMEQSMERLRTSLEAQELLGALMISCCARGPTASSMLGEEMADAKRFAAAFPGIPCLGWYAGGEIGPSARARQASAFRTGEACMQAYTAVFGVFIVPQRDPTTWAALDDTSKAIHAFLKMRLRTNSPLLGQTLQSQT